MIKFPSNIQFSVDCFIVDDLAVVLNTLLVMLLVEIRTKAVRVKLMSWMRQLCWSSQKC